MRVLGGVIDGPQDRGPVHRDAGHLLVIVQQANNVVLAAAAHHGKDFAGKAARCNQDQLAHEPTGWAVFLMALMTRLMLAVSISWNTGSTRVRSLSRSVPRSEALPVSRQR